jgi:steroid 5-alpha reductase family enzyme
MKLSLTQAWEATGLTGMVLRESIRQKLMDRYIKELKERDPKTLNLYAMLWIVVLFFGIGTYIIAAGVAPRVASASIDYSATSNFLAFLGVAILLVGFFLTAYLAGIKLAQTYRKMPYTSRYIYQHRDDDVEL